MEKRLSKLEVVYRRAEQRARLDPNEPVDWRQVPDALPACFAALSELERREWGDLMTAFHAPGAYHRHKDDREFFARLAALDNLIDWHAPPMLGEAA
jgi:hypothetical protein